MATSRNRRLTQARKVKEKAKAPHDGSDTRCAVWQCSRPTQRAARKGLSSVLCHSHLQHVRRHGHATRKSYTRAELEPYREAVKEWLRMQDDNIHLSLALSSLQNLLDSQGRAQDAYYHRSLPPKAKAANILAKAHAAHKSPEQLFEIVLAIKVAHVDLGPRGYPDWQHIQIGKAVKRTRGSSGTHWRDAPYRLPAKYPRSEGGMLRHLGLMVEERAAIAIDPDTIETVRTLRRSR